VPKQRRSQEKVDRILAGTAELLQELPPEDVTVKRILDRADVAAPTFYAYFEDRDAVFQTLGTQIVAEGTALLRSLTEEAAYASWREASDGVVAAYIEWFGERVGLRALWFSGFYGAFEQADRYGNYENAALLRELLESSGARGGVSLDVYRFGIELIDHGISLGFSEDPRGDAVVFGEIPVAAKAYLSTYLD